MTVADLIATLGNLPQDAMVVVDGYEGGVNEASSAFVVSVALNRHEEWYYGKHEQLDSEADRRDGESVRGAVKIT